MANVELGKARVQSNFEVLIDSDAFVGLFLPDDAHFQSVSKQFDHFEREQTKLATTNWVVAETATVLSRRDTQETAKRFLKMIETSGIPILFISREVEKDALRIFKDQSTKNTSVIDCSNIAVLNHYRISRLFSFDKFYKKLSVKMLN